MTVKFASFDVADYLDDEGVIQEYLLAATEDPDPEILLAAKSDVMRARALNAIRKAKTEYKKVYTEPVARPHPSAVIVGIILILTVVVQVILVKSWT
ncbi:MAG TPA: hypothetical protein VLZ74_12750 [Methylocella sp.]|nr:hypothetical protein [Methylocella sp.]